jgi:hypothetical protein
MGDEVVFAFFSGDREEWPRSREPGRFTEPFEGAERGVLAVEAWRGALLGR